MFGLIRFRRSFGFFGQGSWEGQVDFHSLGKRVIIYLVAGRRGPSEAQRNFYGDIESRYSSLIEQFRDVIVDAPLSYFGPNFFGALMPDLAWKDFELHSVTICKTQAGQAVQWALSYLYVPTSETYSIYFEDWTPVDAKLDD